MCGRYAVTMTAEELMEGWGVIGVADFPPLYNIAPTQPIHVVMAGHPRAPGSNLPARQALLARWGFIPGWAKDPKAMPLLINARSETASEKAAFRAAMRHRRALLPASGFYEWRRVGGNARQAYWIRPRDGGPVSFGGLMETWSDPNGSEVDTAAILTTRANEAIAHIHHRMPVVVRPQDFDRWLDCVNCEPRDVADLLEPVEPDFFEAIPVSDLVNRVANTGPQVQERIEPEAEKEPPAEPAEPAGGKQLSLF